MTSLMAGKRGLIMGVANDHSIAWGIAKQLAAAGAELAFTYQGEHFGRRVKPLATSLGSKLLYHCDVEDPAKAGNNALVEMLTTGIPAAPISLKACHMDQQWLPQVKFLGSYTVPKIDVQLGASFQSIAGIEYAKASDLRIRRSRIVQFLALIRCQVRRQLAMGDIVFRDYDQATCFLIQAMNNSWSQLSPNA